MVIGDDPFRIILSKAQPGNRLIIQASANSPDKPKLPRPLRPPPPTTKYKGAGSESNQRPDSAPLLGGIDSSLFLILFQDLVDAVHEFFMLLAFGDGTHDGVSDHVALAVDDDGGGEGHDVLDILARFAI